MHVPVLMCHGLYKSDSCRLAVLEMISLFNINVCRVCMRNDQSYDLTSDRDLLEKFEYSTRLQISKEDNLPKAICSRCTARLKVAYHFIKTAQESENNLKKFLEKISSDFKEVTQGSETSKKFHNEQHFTDDDLLSLINEENHEEIPISSDTGDKNTANYKGKLEDKNLNDNDLQNMQDKDLVNCKNITGYSFSKDILLIDASSEINNAYENNSHLMGISTPDDPGNKCYDEEVEENHELENNQTYSGINMLDSNDESEIRCQSTELAIENSEENHEYGMIINSQDGTIQSIYIDESSAGGTNKQDDDNDCNINNLNEEDNNACIKDEIIEHTEISTKTSSRRGNIVYRFYCDKCNRDFSTKTNLNRHMQSHEGNKPFSCTECKKSFTQKSTLKQHMYIHTGERPYVCEVCNRGFTQCKSLIFHMRRHTGEKPFHCEYCLITFRQKDALRIHILKHHVVIERTTEGNEIFSCIICQRKFETKVEFKTHMKVHTATGEVDNVGEFFQDQEKKSTMKNLSDATSVDSDCFNAAVVNVSASSASEPSRAKKFQCRKCFKCFALKKSLVRHMRIHYVRNDGLLECFDCDLQFSSEDIYQEHLSVCHQYACSACPVHVFRTIQELKIHMIEHDLDQHEQ